MDIIPVDMIQAADRMNRMARMSEASSTGTQYAADVSSASFLDVFKGMYDNVVTTNEQVDRDAIDVMLGNIDDLATVQANIEKAGVAVDLLVTTKNEVLSAYNTIINMQI